MRPRTFAGIMLLALTACSQQEQQQQARIEVENPWTRDTVGRTGSAAVFMTITAPVADRLVGASTSAAAETDLMTMESGDGAMAMAYINGIDLPAGEPVRLDPSGLHVWLADLNAPLKAGESFPLVLEFENAGEQRIDVAVIAPAAPPPGP